MAVYEAIAPNGDMWQMGIMIGFSNVQAPFRVDPVAAAEDAVVLRAVFALFGRWGLAAAEMRILLGSPSERTFQRWRKGEVAALPPDTQWRCGCLLGIHKALRYMFADPARGYDWVRKPNPAFGGHAALEKMLQGAPTDLGDVRAYLDAERAGW